MTTDSERTNYAAAPNRYVDAGGTRFAYRELGRPDGIPVVFLVHLAANLDNWDPAVIDPIAERHRVITVDHAGVGGSDGPVRGSIEGGAHDIAAFLASMDIETADIVGFSMGGFVAQDLVLAHPELVRRLVLAGTGPRGGAGIDKVAATTYKNMLRAAVTRSDPKEYLFFNRDRTGKAAAVDFIRRLGLRVADRDEPVTLSVLQTQLRAIRAFGRSKPSDLSTIVAPVLIVNGDNDVMVPTALSEDLHRRLPNSRLEIYPNSGHGGIFQHHTDFVGSVLDFLSD